MNFLSFSFIFLKGSYLFTEDLSCSIWSKLSIQPTSQGTNGKYIIVNRKEKKKDFGVWY